MAAMTAGALRDAAERPGPNEVRARHHDSIRERHPDVSRSEPAVSHEMTIRLTAADELLHESCLNHVFPFMPGDLSQDLETAPTDYWTERVGDDPIWG